MLDAVLGTIGEALGSFPVEAVAIFAMLVGAGGLILTGWRHLVSGILGLFAAFSTVVRALGDFFWAILMAFGATVRGLIILTLGGVAVWWVLILLSGD